MKQRCWDELLADVQAGDAEAIGDMVHWAESYARALSQDTMEWYRDGHGQRIIVHKRSAECDLHGCVIHCPTDHSMRDFPTMWRGDRGMMERICPHGCGHPDPDGVAFTKRVHGIENAVVESVHGCDGCCRAGD